MSTLLVQPAFSKLHPTGNFQALISNVEETEGLYGKQFKFVIDTDLTMKELGYSLYYYTSQKFSTRSKLGQLIHSVLGETPEDYRGHELDLQQMIGHQLIVKIEHQVKNGKERAVIVDHSLYDERQSNGQRATVTGDIMS